MMTVERASKRWQALKRDLAQDRKRLLFCLLASYLFGLAAHGFAFLNARFTHDSLNALYASAVEERWKIALGRFVVPLYRALRGSYAMPWLIGLLALLYAGCAVYLVARMFRIQSGWLIALAAGIMTTNVTVIAQTATYLYELDFSMLALLLAAAAAFVWQQDRLGLTLTVGSLMTALSLGIYQSYASVTVALIIFHAMLSLLEGEGWKQTLLRGLKGMGMLALGAAVYLLGSHAACAIAGITLEDRVNVLGNLSAGGLAQLLLGTYAWFFSALFNAAYPVAVRIFIDFGAVAAGAVAVLHTVTHDRNVRRPDAALLFVLIAVLPFGSCVICLLSGGAVHDLMYYAAWMAFVFVCALAEWFAARAATPARLKTAVKILCALVVGVMIWQNISIANTVYLKRELEHQAELSAMTRVVADMEAQESYLPGETPVAILGIRSFRDALPGMERVKTITGAQFDAPISTDHQTWAFDLYRAYFAYILSYPVNWCAAEEHSRLWYSDAVADMPAYPSQGYIRMIDGVLVVKMR